MATETETSVAVVAIKADLSHLLKEMKKVSPEAAAMTKDLVSAVNKNLKDLEKTYDKLNQQIVNKTKDTAKKVGKSWNDIGKSMQSNQMISDMEQIGSMFTLLGGNVSKMSMLFVSGVRPVAMLSEVLTAAFGPQAPLLLGLAALPAAGLAAVAMLKGLADSGLEAFKNLEKLHIKVDKEARQAFEEYEGSTKRLAIAMDQLKVSVSSDVADAFADMIEITAFAVEQFETMHLVVTNFVRGGLIVLTLGMSELARGIVWAGNVARDVFADALRESRRELDALVAVQLSHSQALATAVKVTEEYKKKVHDAMVEGMYWREEQEKMLVALGMMVSVEDEDKEKKDALTAATKASAEAERIRGEYLRANEAILRDAIDYEALYLEKKDERLEAMEQEKEAAASLLKETDALIKRNDAQMASYLEKRATVLRDVWMDIANSSLSAVGTLTDAIVAGYERRAASGEELSDKEKTLAGLAYGLSQSFAATQAIISAASMAIGMAAQMAPYTGPAAPGIAAALAGTMLAAQLATIAAAPPPEFPTGGMVSPDHRVVATRGDEGILAARAVRAVGGPDGVDALNEGATIGSGDGPETVRILRSIREALQPPRGPGVFRAMRGRRV